jgi:hypothetical protein
MTMIIIDFDSYWAENPKLQISRDDSDLAIDRHTALSDFWKRHEAAINGLDARLDPAMLHPEADTEE